jgi:hypothetical protein
MWSFKDGHSQNVKFLSLKLHEKEITNGLAQKITGKQRIKPTIILFKRLY